VKGEEEMGRINQIKGDMLGKLLADSSRERIADVWEDDTNMTPEQQISSTPACT